jgi:exonuclease III
VLVVDGFLVSDNVTVLEKHVIDADFETSDHNPVSMTFVLN